MNETSIASPTVRAGNTKHRAPAFHLKARAYIVYTKTASDPFPSVYLLQFSQEVSGQCARAWVPRAESPFEEQSSDPLPFRGNLS
jgi:hypothetical protein